MIDGRSGRPDLVLIMTDQQRHDQIGYASGGLFETPVLDDLAGKGLIFETAYSAATTCVPARSSLLTGILPHRLPTQEPGKALREGFWTLPRELRRAGYETALIGKMHFAPVHANHGFETMRLSEHLSAQGVGPISRDRGDLVDDHHEWLARQGIADWRLPRNGPMPADAPADAHPTAWIEHETAAFLAGRDRRRPLFLIISFPHPHAPYDPPEPYASMYDPADSPPPPTAFDVNEPLPHLFQLALTPSRTRKEAANPRRVRRFIALVRGLVRQIDDAIGRLVASLDLDNTVIFFTSDHGDFSGHRGLMRKNPWIPFDDLARVAFFVTGGPVVPGRRLREPVQSCDFARTCLDLAGLQPPADLNLGTRSLLPALKGAPLDPDRAVVSSTDAVGWPMIRRGAYKYIEHPFVRVGRSKFTDLSRHDHGVLFNIETDPLERENLANDRAHRAARDELTFALSVVTSESAFDSAGSALGSVR